ncbi:MAG: hypothetical protein AB7O96_18930, partial [Pseudobdellovibrionaceae bacterium]
GKFYSENQDVFSSFSLEFTDPYEGRGGFGASTAQFAMLYALKTWKDTILLEPERQLDLRELLEDYKKQAWSGEGLPPSGADLVAQVRGGLTYFEKNKSKLKSWSWPFSKLDFAVVPTGFKMPTHEHLRRLSANHFASLEGPVYSAVESLKSADQESFVRAIRAFRAELRKLELTATSTESLLKDLEKVPEVLAAKGCGAMGADVLMVFFEKDHRYKVLECLRGKNLYPVATSESLSDGIRIRLDGDFRKKGGIALL